MVLSDIARNQQDYTERVITQSYSENYKQIIDALLKEKPRPFPPNSQGLNAQVPSISFLMPNGQTVRFAHHSTITIGRNDPSHGIEPTFDLNSYDGQWLGVSRVHAKVVYANKKFHIMDMSSTNGVKINFEKITPQMLVPIYPGDRLSFGHLDLIVEEIG